MSYRKYISLLIKNVFILLAIFFSTLLVISSAQIEEPLTTNIQPPQVYTKGEKINVQWTIQSPVESIQLEVKDPNDQPIVVEDFSGGDPNTITTNYEIDPSIQNPKKDASIFGKYKVDISENFVKENRSYQKRYGVDFFYEPARGDLRVIAFEDINKNLAAEGAPRLSGWKFEHIDPHGGKRTYYTDKNGEIFIPGVGIGRHTIKEMMQDGWENTMPVEQIIEVEANKETTAYFGNAKIIPPTVDILNFEDRNGNGAKEDNEPGLEGWQFAIDGPNATTTNITDSNGKVQIKNPPGTYKIRAFEKPGWKMTTSAEKTVSLKSGEHAALAFGSKLITGNLTIVKFKDDNQDGLQNNGELGLDDWEFNVSWHGGSRLVRTGNDGTVYLADLAAGSYTVTETKKAGWLSKTPMQQNVVIADMDEKTVTFANYIDIGILNVMAFEDSDINGILERDLNGSPLEVGLSGWDVIVTFPDGSKKVYRTNSSGAINIELPSGVYKISEVLKSGWVITTRNEQQQDITPGSSKLVEFGAYLPGNITKFWDKNGNGIQDKGEPGLEGWEFEITGPSGTITRITDSNVNIVLTGLSSGSYMAEEMLAEGQYWYNTTPRIQSITVPQSNLFFGNDRYRYLNITKFNDLNRNGIRDSGEIGLSGWEFQVSEISNPVYTGINGNATVRVKANREYTVSESLPTGWYNSTPLKVSTFIDPQYENFSVAFGDYFPKPPVINISSYYDENSNDVRDQDETVLSNQSFWVRDPNDNVQKATAGEAGYVEFKGTIAGVYTIEEMLSESPCWYNTTPRIVSQNLAFETKTDVEFGNNQSIQRCTCESIPTESTQNLMIDAQNVTIYKIIDPSVISPSKINQKDGTVINYTFAICVKPKLMPTDMVLAVDTSGSLIENGPSTLNAISNAIAKFVNAQKTASDHNLRIGLVSWDDNIDETVIPTTNYTSILGVSSGLKANPHEITNYSVGMNGALNAFDKATSSGSEKVIVIVTDAQGEYKPFLNYPRKSSEYTIHAIVVGPVEVNDTYSMLRNLTTKHNGSLITVDDPSKIGDALKDLADLNMAKAQIKNVKVVETLPGYLKPLGYSADRPNMTINEDGNAWRSTTYEWNIANISSDECWSSGISTLFCGRIPTDIGLPEGSSKINSEVLYTDENGAKKAIKIPEGTIWIVPSSSSA